MTFAALMLGLGRRYDKGGVAPCSPSLAATPSSIYSRWRPVSTLLAIVVEAIVGDPGRSTKRDTGAGRGRTGNGRGME